MSITTRKRGNPAKPFNKRGPEGDFGGSSPGSSTEQASPFRKGGLEGDFSPSPSDPPQQPTLVAQAEGSVAGMIQYTPEGDDGFGYDPVFYLPSYGKTIAQLSLDEKNMISHRAGAARTAVKILKQLTPNS